MQSDNESERQGAISEWHGVKEQILGVMLRVFTTELRDTYLTTVIEQVHMQYSIHFISFFAK